MLHASLARSLWFVVLIVAQALVFNHIHLFGYATPLPYVYVLLILPHRTPRWVYVLTGFVTGLAADAVSSTPGVAAAALTAVALAVPGLLRACAPDERLDEVFTPGVRTMAWSGFLKFAATVSLPAVAGVYALESFSLFDPAALGLNIAGSYALTLVLLAVMERVRMAFSAEEKA